MNFIFFIQHLDEAFKAEMLNEIQQVLRLVMLMGKHRQKKVLKTSGGLLVLLWTESTNCAPVLNCTVAAAGPWCAHIQTKALQHVLSDLQESLSPCMRWCSEPDPEELRSFTDVYGSLRLLLSFQMRDGRHYSSEWRAHIEKYLRFFSSANAGVAVHLRFKFSEPTSQPEMRAKIKRKLALTDQSLLILDVTCSTEPPLCIKTGCWCQGGHPVLGCRLPLSIPPQAMDQGLFGDLSVQFVTLLSPCVEQYPNLTTELTRIQLLVFSPSNVPVSRPSGFFQTLPAALDCQELGLDRLYCSSYKELQYSSATVYTVEAESRNDPERESRLSSVPQQSLLLFLFLRHSDPFTSQLTDVMASEVLIERHLEDILGNNKKAVADALQTELRNALKAQNKKRMNQEKLLSAADVVVASTISIVSCSTNLDFRTACLNHMKVCNTRDLSASLKESLRRVTSWKFVPRSRCYSTQMDKHPESEEQARTEM